VTLHDAVHHHDECSRRKQEKSGDKLTKSGPFLAAGNGTAVADIPMELTKGKHVMP
jgi:hypothetical protein